MNHDGFRTFFRIKSVEFGQLNIYLCINYFDNLMSHPFFCFGSPGGTQLRNDKVPLREHAGRIALVVDDDPEIRLAITSSLTQEGYAVLEARDGRLAEALLTRQTPDVIICDIKMPHLDGLGLLSKVRSRSPIPFILMTGYAELLGRIEAKDFGATDFILKPFGKDELLTCIELALSEQTEAATPAKEHSDARDGDLDYCRLSIDEFIAGKISIADIFVRLTEKKYVRVARAGSELSMDRIRTYREKGLSFLYIKKSDFARYVGMNIELTKIVSRSSKVPKENRLRLMKHTSEILVQEVYLNGASKEKLEIASALVEAMISTIAEDNQIFELLEILRSHADYLYAHSLAVALYSSMVAKEIGWTGAPTLFKITLGGLLHDIGKKEIPRNILEKPRSHLTQSEREIYETHPLRSKEILSLINAIPDDVVQIAMHHHENSLGRGFPYRLLKSKIHPLAKLVAVVNAFCEMTLHHGDGFDVLSPHAALAKLYSLNGLELDLNFLKALMVIFDFPIPEGMPKSALPLQG